MKIKTKNLMIVKGLFTAMLLSLAARAADTERDFGFAGHEIFRFKKGTSCLRVADINNDRSDDIIFANNRASRIEILLSGPETAAKGEKKEKSTGMKTLEEVFRNIGFICDQRVKDINVSDIDGDGRKDIVSIGEPYGLEVRYQKEKGAFAKPFRPYLGVKKNFVKVETLDIDGNGKKDIVLCRKDALIVLWNFNASGKFEKKSEIKLSSDNCVFFDIAHFTGRPRKDLVLYFRSSMLPLRLCPSGKSGIFGWGIPSALDNIQGFDTVDNFNSARAFIGTILKNDTVFRLYEYSPEKTKPLFENELINPERLPLSGTSEKYDPAWLLRDINGDGFSDFCLASSELSQLHIFYGNEKGFCPDPEIINTLSGIRKVAADKDGDIIVFSPSEKLIAMHMVKDLKKFPLVLKTPAPPCAFDICGAKNFVICREKDTKKTKICEIEWEKKDGTVKNCRQYPLELKNIPSDMTAFRMDKNLFGFIVFLPYQRPFVFRIKGQEAVAVSGSELDALSSLIKPFYISVCGKNNDGRDSLVICENRLAREYEWDGVSFRIIRQFNPSEKAASLAGVCGFSESGKDAKGFLFFDRNNDDLLFFPEKNGNSDALSVHIDGRVKDFAGMRGFSCGDRNGLLMVSAKEALVFMPGMQTYSLKIKSEYASPAEKPELWNFFPVFVGKNKRPVIALLDKNNRSVEIIGLNKNGRLEKLLVFEVFQKPMRERRKKEFEPHDLASGDINGDGIQDLVMLVHDKLIIYLGE